MEYGVISLQQLSFCSVMCETVRCNSIQRQCNIVFNTISALSHT